MDKVSFQGRNQDILKAYKIMHKINTGFPAVCPWKMDVLSEKHFGKNTTGAPVFYEKLCILRDNITPDNTNEYDYAAKTLEAIKQFKTANCKEYSELGYLIAIANNIKNCYCANIYARTSGKASELKDFTHSILLITPEKIKNAQFVNKYFAQPNTDVKSIIPDKKTILIDPVTGIVDYWKNALAKYSGTVLNDISTEKEVCVYIREPLFSNDKLISKLKKDYPILNFNNKSCHIKMHHNFKPISKRLKCFKKFYPELFAESYPAERQNPLKNLITKIEKCFSL
jgi:hypothetical protein